MTLLARFVPDFQFVERHDILVAAPAGRVLDIAIAYDPADDPWIRRLMRLREAPQRLAAAFGAPAARVKEERFGKADFLPLGRDGDREAAFGLIGRFWRPDFGLETIPDPGAFAAFDRPGVAKLAWNLHAEPQGGGMVRLSTETRIHCPDRRTRWLFRPYWLVIRPVSGLIRRRMLVAVKRAAEA